MAGWVKYKAPFIFFFLCCKSASGHLGHFGKYVILKLRCDVCLKYLSKKLPKSWFGPHWAEGRTRNWRCTSAGPPPQVGIGWQSCLNGKLSRVCFLLLLGHPIMVQNSVKRAKSLSKGETHWQAHLRDLEGSKSIWRSLKGEHDGHKSLTSFFNVEIFMKN